MPSHTELGEFIWRIADHLRGDYEKNDNEDVILPFTLLRRLDCVLEKTRDKVRETEATIAGKVTDDVLKKVLIGAAGVPFYNRSKFSFTELLKDPANIKENFGSYLDGFSDNIKEILYNFSGGEEKGLAPIYETLARKNLLYLITKEFASEDLDLHPDVVTNHEMGLIYEYLIRKFKEGAAAGEPYTPRDVVQLLVQLVLADVEHTLKKSKGTLVAIYEDTMASTTNALTQPGPLSFLANLWRRWPITTVAIGLVIAVWIYDHLSASAGSAPLRPNVAIQYVPPTPLKPLSGTRTATSRARDSRAPLSAFRRARVGENEVNYIAEGVTIRLFTPRPTPAQVPHLIRQLNIGQDVTVRYFAYKPELAPQTRPDSAAAQSVERSLPTSK
jgi:hypothetical protein